MKAAPNTYPGALREHFSASSKSTDAGARSPDKGRGNPERGFAGFLARNRASLLVLSGPGSGLEIRLDQARFTLGRGPGVDLAIDDVSLVGEAVAVEFNGSGFALQGAHLSSCLTDSACSYRSERLCHGDRFKVGDVCFEYALRARA